MDIQNLDLKSVDEIKAETLWNAEATKKAKGESIVEHLAAANLDSTSSSQLDALKAQTEKSEEPGRAAYIEQLKAAVANGEYEVSSDDLADALLKDGFSID